MAVKRSAEELGCPHAAKRQKVEPTEEVWNDLKQDLVELFNCNDSYDAGSYGPVLIRLAWHSSGTYCAHSKTGGSNGATMRYPPESTDDANAGLDVARALLIPLQEKYPSVSFADLWIYAAYVFLEYSNGPCIEFTAGREDKTEKDAIANGRLPAASFGINTDIQTVDAQGRVGGWEKAAQHVKDVFSRMGFTIQETVALVCGGHAYGQCHVERSGYQGPWVKNPTAFSNDYAVDLINEEWAVVDGTNNVGGNPVDPVVCPASGKIQYVRVVPEDAEDKSQRMMLVADMVFLWDDEFRPVLESYAADLNVLKQEFGAAFKKLTELGCTSSPTREK